MPAICLVFDCRLLVSATLKTHQRCMRWLLSFRFSVKRRSVVVLTPPLCQGENRSLGLVCKAYSRTCSVSNVSGLCDNRRVLRLFANRCFVFTFLKEGLPPDDEVCTVVFCIFIVGKALCTPAYGT